jgi:hypothetical protein
MQDGRDHERDAAVVTGFLRRLAQEPPEVALPPASDLYRRARLLDKLFGEPTPIQAAMRRLALADVLGVLLAGAALITWLAWAGAGMAQRVPAWPVLPLLGSPQWAASVLVFAAVGASLSFLALWPLLAAED